MKILKRILLCILCVLMLVSVCSCDYIDELRENSAYFQKDKSIVYDGQVFIPFEMHLERDCEMEGYDQLNICMEGEPILWPVIMESLGFRWSYIYINDQQTVISDHGSSKFYIREDVYDNISNELIDFNKGNCLVKYDDYRLENGGELFSEQDSKALIEVMNQEPVSLDSLKGYYNDYGSFYKYSLNGTFFEYSSHSLAECDEKYYLVDHKYGEAYLASGRAEEILKEIMEKINTYEH